MYMTSNSVSRIDEEIINGTTIIRTGKHGCTTLSLRPSFLSIVFRLSPCNDVFFNLFRLLSSSTLTRHKTKQREFL